MIVVPSVKDTSAPLQNILPVLVALAVQSIQIVERAQVDWAVDCSSSGLCAEATADLLWLDLFSWMLPIFVFAILHSLTVRYPNLQNASFPERAARVAVFAFVTVYPSFGWYLWFAGIGAGFLAAVTVVGLVIAPLAGVVGAGATAGLLMAFAAGPKFKSSSWPIWKSVLCRYAMAGAVCSTIAVGGHVLFDPQFGGYGTSLHMLSAYGLLASTAIGCMLFLRVTNLESQWLPAVTAPSSWFLRLGVLATTILVLSAAAHVAIGFALRIDVSDRNIIAPIVSFVRGSRPLLSTQLSFGGLNYIGPRSAIQSRTARRLSPNEFKANDPGTTSSNVNKNDDLYVPEWRIDPPSNKSEAIYVSLKEGTIDFRFDCIPSTSDQEFCLSDSPKPLPANAFESRRRIAIDMENGHIFSKAASNSSLGIRFDNSKNSESPDPANWPRLYCRLNLTDVTSAGFAVHQIIPCDTDWIIEAQTIRLYVESLFRAP